MRAMIRPPDPDKRKGDGTLLLPAPDVVTPKAKGDRCQREGTQKGDPTMGAHKKIVKEIKNWSHNQKIPDESAF